MSSRIPTASQTATAVLCAALPVEGGKAPEWVQVIPAGAFTAVDGRAWTLKDATAVIAASLAGAAGGILAIDYDHAADLAAPKGLPAPAAGWMTALEARADGIWARVDWTPAGGAAVAAKEYRFLSPAFHHAKDGAVTSILGAGLVNRPALHQLAQLASHQGDRMDPTLQGLLAALGLPETTDQATALAAVTALKAGATTPPAALCSAVGLQAGASADTVALAAKAAVDGVKAIAAAAGLAADAGVAQVVTAVTALKAGSSIADGQVVALTARLQALEADKTMGKVDAAIAAGKFPPAQRDNLLALAAADPARLDAWIASQPVVLKPGTADPATGKPPVDGALTAEQKSVCTAMGLSEDAYKKALAAQTAEG